MTRVLPVLCVVGLLVLGATALAPRLRAQQQQRSAADWMKFSHEVNADGSVTLRYKDIGASKVEVSTDMSLKPIPMTKGDDGVWTATTAPLKPEIYGYTFVVDGTPTLDPHNRDVRHNLAMPSSEVRIPATPPAPWEMTDIPHGTLSRYAYTTHVAKNLPANQELYVVYTPPNYDARHKGGYPVLYLLHGYTDAEDGWAAVGRAQFILDSLIATGKAVPMIVVMPMGYGNWEFLKGGFANWQDPVKVNENTDLYSQMLLTEIMPAVDHEYNIAKGRDNHAIAGLSMGGLESLTVGLNNTDKFAYVAGFSSAIHHEQFDTHFPGIDPRRANLKLLWVACGVDDGLITPNRHFVTWAKAKGLPITPIETPGAHTWLVWRDNLLNLAPLLFKQ